MSLRIKCLYTFWLDLSFDRRVTYCPIRFKNFRETIYKLLKKYKSQDFPQPDRDFMSCNFLPENIAIKYVGWDLPFHTFSKSELEEYLKIARTHKALTIRNNSLADTLTQQLEDGSTIVVWAGQAHLPHTFMSYGGDFYKRAQSLTEMYTLAEQENHIAFTTKPIFDALQKANVGFLSGGMNKCYF